LDHHYFVKKRPPARAHGGTKRSRAGERSPRGPQGRTARVARGPRTSREIKFDVPGRSANHGPARLRANGMHPVCVCLPPAKESSRKLSVFLMRASPPTGRAGGHEGGHHATAQHRSRGSSFTSASDMSS
jgi:hypothetical protein